MSEQPGHQRQMVISDAATDNHSIKARGAMSSKGSGRATQPFAPTPVRTLPAASQNGARRTRTGDLLGAITAKRDLVRPVRLAQAVSGSCQLGQVLSVW